MSTLQRRNNRAGQNYDQLSTDDNVSIDYRNQQSDKLIDLTNIGKRHLWLVLAVVVIFVFTFSEISDFMVSKPKKEIVHGIQEPLFVQYSNIVPDSMYNSTVQRNVYYSYKNNVNNIFQISNTKYDNVEKINDVVPTRNTIVYIVQSGSARFDVYKKDGQDDIDYTQILNVKDSIALPGFTRYSISKVGDKPIEFIEIHLSETNYRK